MAGYLRFYHLERSPFESEPKKGLVLGTRSLKAAYSEIKRGLEEESPRICLSGPPGVGKTSLCRALPKLLGESAQVVQILNPRRPWEEIRQIIARKLELPGDAVSRVSLESARRRTGGRLVLLIDQAELISHETLDHLDVLLQYLNDDGGQLVNCVLLADLEAASSGVEIPLLWWLDKFTTLQLQFEPIPANGIRHYVQKHLAKAGHSGDDLFSDDACMAIHRYTGGLPGAINELCERALVEASVRALEQIDASLVEEMMGDAGTAKAIFENSNSLSDAVLLVEEAISPSAQQLLDESVHTPSAGASPEPEPVFEKPFDPPPLTDDPMAGGESFEPMSGVFNEAASGFRARAGSSPSAESSSESAGLELVEERVRIEETAVVPSMRSAPPRSGKRRQPKLYGRSPREGARSSRFVTLLVVLVGTLAWLQYSGEYDLVGPLLDQLEIISHESVTIPPIRGQRSPTRMRSSRQETLASALGLEEEPDELEAREIAKRELTPPEEAVAEETSPEDDESLEPRMLQTLSKPAETPEPIVQQQFEPVESKPLPDEYRLQNEYTAVREAADVPETAEKPIPARPTPESKPAQAPAKPAPAPTRPAPTPVAPALEPIISTN